MHVGLTKEDQITANLTTPTLQKGNKKSHLKCKISNMFMYVASAQFWCFSIAVWGSHLFLCNVRAGWGRTGVNIAEVLCVCVCVCVVYACWFQAEGEECHSESSSSVSCLLRACA